MKFWKVMALMLVALLALSPMQALAEAASDGGAQVTVSGTGVVNLRPDTATITLGVSETAKGAVAAQTTVNKKIVAVKKALIKAGAKEADISVSDLSVWGVYDYSGETQKLTGYSASHTLNITTADMEQVGPLVDAALDAGANQLQGVNFSVKDDGEAYNQALKLAVEKAREKAEVLAAATGVTLGSLVSLNESGNFGYAPYANAKYAAADEGMGAAPTQVDTGLVTVSATVTAVYGLES